MALRIVTPDEKPSPKSRYRQLRHFMRMAHTYHECRLCGEPIFPGDLYEANVVIKDAGGIYVAKYHYDPSCPHDPFEDPFDHDEERNANAPNEEVVAAPRKAA